MYKLSKQSNFGVYLKLKQSVVKDQNLTRKPIPWKAKKEHGSWQKKAQLLKLRRTMKAQRPKKNKKNKEKVKKKRAQTWDMSGIRILREANPLRESLGDLEKDVDSLEDPKKDMGDLEDRTSHS